MLIKPRMMITSYFCSTRTAPLPDSFRQTRVDTEATTFQFGKRISEQIDSLSLARRIPSHRGTKRKNMENKV